MKKNIFLLTANLFLLHLIGYSQNNNWETKIVSKIEIQDQTTGSWVEKMTFRKLEFGINSKKDLSFSDESNVFVTLMAGNENKYKYDGLYFENIKEISNENYSTVYSGKFKLLSKNDFTITGDAYVYFYYDKGGKLGVIEIRNNIGNRAVRVWLNN